MANAIIILLIFLAAAYTLIHLFFHKGLSSIAVPESNEKPFFSVIIAARNEEANIKKCIERILAQSYPSNKFEIIVADDRSTDSTAAIIESCASIDKRIRLVKIGNCPVGVSPKKNAVSEAVSYARGEVLLFTDADSTVPSGWMECMASHLAPDTDFVSGLTKFYKTGTVSDVWFNLQQTDFLSHGIVSAAAISAGLPLNTNANNLAVRRLSFNKVNGYRGVECVVSGDDDLLLQRLKKAGGKVKFAASPLAAVETKAAANLREWWEQRKRWSSKTVYYDRKAVFLLSFVFSYYLLIFTAVFLSLLIDGLFYYGIIAFVHKTILDAFLYFRGCSLLKCKLRGYWFWLLAPLHIPIIVFAVLFGVFGRFRWKDGRVSRKLAVSVGASKC